MQTVFFSYSRYHHGQELQQAGHLLSERLAEAGLKEAVFLDVGMNAGDAWREKIDSALKEATVFIAVLEPAYWRSKYCRDEVVQALERAREEPHFRIIPVSFKPIDSAELNLDARQLYDELLQLQAQSAREGFTTQVVGDLANLVIRFQNEEKSGVTDDYQSRGVVRDMRRLLCNFERIDSLEPVLFSVPKLRNVLLHVPSGGSFETRMNTLVLFIIRQPELALALMYQLRRVYPGMPGINDLLETVRDLGSNSRVQPGDPISCLFDLLSKTQTDIVFDLRIELGEGWEFLGVLAGRQGAQQNRVMTVLRVLSSRNCLTLEFFDAISARIPVHANTFAELKERVPIPEYRLRLIEFMTELFMGDPQLLLWWLQCDSKLNEMLHFMKLTEAPYRLFRDIVERCDVRGYLSETFFSRLVVFAPHRLPDILSVAQRWGHKRLQWKERFWRERLTLLLAELDDEIEHLVVLAYGILPGHLMDADDGVPLLLRLANLLKVLEHGQQLNRSIYGIFEARFPGHTQALREIELIMLKEENRADLLSKPPPISTRFQQAGQWSEPSDEIRAAAARLQATVHADATSAKWRKDMRKILVSSYTSGAMRLLASDIGILGARLPAAPVTREVLAHKLLDEAMKLGVSASLMDLLCEKVAEH